MSIHTLSFKVNLAIKGFMTSTITAIIFSMPIPSVLHKNLIIADYETTPKRACETEESGDSEIERTQSCKVTFTAAECLTTSSFL